MSGSGTGEAAQHEARGGATRARWQPLDEAGAAAYDLRFDALAEQGLDVHGEARFVLGLGPGSVLDAGCGTGRVAIEIARHGVEVVGVDRDLAMLELARSKAPGVCFVEADLAALDLGRSFDVVVAAGNVLAFVDAGTEPAVITALARHVAPGGLLVAGFSLEKASLTLERYDETAARSGLQMSQRLATWSGDPYGGGDYAVSVHRRPPA